MAEFSDTIRRNYEKYRSEIAARFFGRNDPGEITSLSDKGDRHLHGAAVTQITTSAGYVFYYKPGDSRSADLLGDINELLFRKRMVPPQITAKGFAFQKAVERKIPEKPVRRASLYKNMGRLLAVFYALGSTDMHRTNIICSRGESVVIDTETLLSAKAEDVGGIGDFPVDYGEVFPECRMSVGECMFLPRFYGGRQISPMLPGEGCTPERYETQFLEGFEEGYEQITGHYHEILKILNNYDDVKIRYVLHSTQSYTRTRKKHDEARDSDARKKALKGLEKGLYEADMKRWEKVLEWEKACIREGDIPYFWIEAGGKDLYGDITEDPLISGYLKYSPIEYAAWRIRHMNTGDLDLQIAYIHASLRHIDGWGYSTDVRPETEPSELSAAITAEEAVHEVEETIVKLRDERIRLSEGKYLWHMPMIKGRPGCLFGLAEGFSGIAVFAHACAASPLLSEYYARKAKDTSLACFRDMAAFAEYLIRTCPEGPDEQNMSIRFNGDFGFKEGLAGLLWAISYCRSDDPARADRILEKFGSWGFRVSGDPEFGRICPDIMDLRDMELQLKLTDTLESGNAGTAAAFIKRFRTEKDPEALAAAARLLKGMLSRKQNRGFYTLFRPGRKQYFLPAFLCGNTGIAWVMLKFAEAADQAK